MATWDCSALHSSTSMSLLATRSWILYTLTWCLKFYCGDYDVSFVVYTTIQFSRTFGQRFLFFLSNRRLYIEQATIYSCVCSHSHRCQEGEHWPGRTFRFQIRHRRHCFEKISVDLARSIQTICGMLAYVYVLAWNKKQYGPWSRTSARGNLQGWMSFRSPIRHWKTKCRHIAWTDLQPKSFGLICMQGEVSRYNLWFWSC